MAELRVPISREELAKLLGGWFYETAGVRNRWNEDPVGVVIKEQVERLGHWKNRARGNPAKGYRKMVEGRSE